MTDLLGDRAVATIDSATRGNVLPAQPALQRPALAVGRIRMNVANPIDAFGGNLADNDVRAAVTAWCQAMDLRDPGDEMVLEAAINGQADAIVTFNRRDFHHCSDPLLHRHIVAGGCAQEVTP